jgi:hypothetical protein
VKLFKRAALWANKAFRKNIVHIATNMGDLIVFYSYCQTTTGLAKRTSAKRDFLNSHTNILPQTNAQSIIVGTRLIG